MNFDIKRVKGVVTGVVPRNASEESEIVVAVSLELSDVPVESVSAAFRCNDVGDAAILFRDPAQDEAEGTIFPNLKAMVAIEGWKKKHAIKIGSQKKIRVMSITGIHATPRAKGMFDVELTASIESPPEGFIEYLANNLKASLWVELEQVEQELPLKQKDEESGETQDTLGLQEQPKRRGRPPKEKAE